MMRRYRWMAAVLIAAVLPAVAGAAVTTQPASRPVAKSATKPAKASPPKVAVFQLSDIILEKPPEISFGFDLSGHGRLYDLVRRLKQAAGDDSLKAVVLTFDEPIMGWGQLQELRAALLALRAARKDVHCYVEDVGGGLYQLASAATRIVIAPAGGVDLTGLHAEMIYLKGLMDKIRLEADIEHMGAYKSAGEMFTQTGPSDEALENMEWLIQDLFDQMAETIAEGRQMTPDRVRELIDDGPYNARQALKAQLVDEILDADALVDTLNDKYGEGMELVRDYGRERGPEVDLSSPFAFFKLIGESISKKKAKAKESVAVAYVDGMIVTGQTEPGFFGDSGEVGSTTVRRMFARLRDDDDIKAVVVRVDSPGGSATASDVMWQSVRDLADAKPTVVSMGNVAASGGYYLSVGAPTIFADPGTITGSIGVVGGKLVTKGLWDWIGVSFHEIGRGRNADLYASNRRFDDRQREIIRGQLKHVYGLFADRVETGRKDRLKKDFDELAGGRVFTGRQAKELGLVDRLGGLADAVVFAAQQAEVKDYEVREFPQPENFFDLFMKEMTGREGSDEEGGGISLRSGGTAGRLRSGPAAWLFSQPAVSQFVEALQKADPARARSAVRALLRLELLRRHQTLFVMPEEILIR
ncbi:MAG TPA: signal peptide peptidase SppA [Phycisphaerae bacterium]|nr:signal peptide peptidase SppA [Phycisphaerae bacterium]